MTKWLALGGIVAGVVLALWMNFSPPPTDRGVARTPHRGPPLLSERRNRDSERCEESEYARAAVQNANTLHSLSWSPFGPPEQGWETYVPLIAREIGTACSPRSPGFASALAHWQRTHGLGVGGEFDAGTFSLMNSIWQRERLFAAHGAGCPAPADESSLVAGRPAEGYNGKFVQLAPGAFEAYRRMVRDARAQDPAIGGDVRYLTIVSAYRSPGSDAARCATENNCEGVRRARCSVHSTGRAVDFYVGGAPGYDPTSTADPNRVFMSKSPAYRWLVANAHKYGFIPYPFEPWHWEWVGPQEGGKAAAIHP